MRKNKLVIVNGERYLVYKCLNCHHEMKFKVRHNAPIRIHGACTHCGKTFEVLVDPR